jgi:hypothetical protein
MTPAFTHPVPLLLPSWTRHSCQWSRRLPVIAAVIPAAAETREGATAWEVTDDSAVV